jgi:hypothetical protein
VFKASDFSKVCRGDTPSHDPDPPPYLTVPTTLARTAVRKFHRQGEAVAKQYLASSKVGSWANHPTSSSMATNNTRVLDGLDWYIQEDKADGRAMNALDATAIVTIQGIDVETRIDVVLDDGNGLAGRVVFWDGPDFDAATAQTIACPYAFALEALYPGATYTTIGVWQARRRYSVEVPHGDALGSVTAAGQVLAGM